MLKKCLFGTPKLKKYKFISFKFSSNKTENDTVETTISEGRDNDKNFKDKESMDAYLNQKMENLNQTVSLTKVMTADPRVVKYYIPHLCILFFIEGPEIMFLYQALWAIFPFATQVNYRALINPDIREQLYIVHHLIEESEKKSSTPDKIKKEPDPSEYIKLKEYKNLIYEKLLRKLLFTAFLGLGIAFYSLFIFSEMKNKFIITEYYLYRRGYSEVEIDNYIEKKYSKLPLIYYFNWALISYCNLNRHNNLITAYKLSLLGLLTAFILSWIFSKRYKTFIKTAKDNELSNKLRPNGFLDSYLEKVKMNYLLELQYLKELTNNI